MSSGGLRLRARREGEVWVVVVAGAITEKNSASIRKFIGKLFRQLDARAAVVDLRNAVIALTPEGWAHVAIESLDGHNPVEAPVALIVLELNRAVVDEHCARMREGGRFRRVCCEYAPAYDWASRCLARWAQPPAKHAPSTWVSPCPMLSLRGHPPSRVPRREVCDL
jgi:hypothetical protein